MSTRSEKFLETFDKVVGKIEETKMTEEIASTVEGLAAFVVEEDQYKFDGLLDKYLSVVDPDLKMTLGEAIEKLGEKKANELLRELVKLNYEDPDDEDEEE